MKGTREKSNGSDSNLRTTQGDVDGGKVLAARRLQSPIDIRHDGSHCGSVSFLEGLRESLSAARHGAGCWELVARMGEGLGEMGGQGGCHGGSSGGVGGPGCRDGA